MELVNSWPCYINFALTYLFLAFLISLSQAVGFVVTEINYFRRRTTVKIKYEHKNDRPKPVIPPKKVRV